MKTAASFPVQLLRVLAPAWLLAILLMALLSCQRSEAAEPVTARIGSPGMPRTDAATAARLCTDRTTVLGGQPVSVRNAPVGSALRQRCMARVLPQHDDQYRADRAVRRQVGKGAPPHTLATGAAVIAHVQASTGAVGTSTPAGCAAAST